MSKVQLFRSDDVGAPQLTSSMGSLISLLDACLLAPAATAATGTATSGQGFFNKVTTMTRADAVIVAGVRTNQVKYTFSSPHGFRKYQTIFARASAANASFTGGGRIVAANSLSVTVELMGVPSSDFIIADANAVAYVMGAMWIKGEAGINTAAYHSWVSTDGGNLPCSLSVDDTYGTYAKVRGFETMLSPITGDGMFPTLAQQANYAIPKNVDATTPAPWILLVDGTMFYLFTSTYPNVRIFQGFVFGYPKTRMAADEYGCVIHAMPAANATWSGGLFMNSGLNNASYPLYYARGISQIGGSVPSYAYGNGICGFGNGSEAFPSPIDNGLNVAPVYLYSSGFRSILKGCLQPLHNMPLYGGGFYDGLTDYPNQNVIAIPTSAGYTSPQSGEVHFIIDGSW